MKLFNYILWDIDPSIFELFGQREVRWYGLLWALSFLIGQQIMSWSFEKEGRNKKEAESLTVYMIVSTILGARLGHCFFYDGAYYLKNIHEVLYIWEGGLASHGAAIGIIIGMILYVRKFKPKSFFWLMDRVAICVALAGAFIRFGNVMNSEIIGTPSDSNYSFAFVKNTEKQLLNVSPQLKEITFNKTEETLTVDDFNYPKVNIELDFNSRGITSAEDVLMLTKTRVLALLKNIESNKNIPEDHHIVLLNTQPDIKVKKIKNGWKSTFDAFLVTRHPAQLYEAISCFILFIILFLIYLRLKSQTPEGLLFGIFLIIVFGLRFVWETMKEVQVTFEKTMSLNMGQWLSIPFIIIGIGILVFSLKKKIL